MRSGQRSKAFVLATTSVQLQIKWGEVEFITLVVGLCCLFNSENLTIKMNLRLLKRRRDYFNSL